jgi:hypothetical protein
MDEEAQGFIGGLLAGGGRACGGEIDGWGSSRARGGVLPEEEEADAWGRAISWGRTPSGFD